jgi:hypothetical protein
VQSKDKLSKLERKLNKYIYLVVGIQFIFALTAAFFNCLLEVILLKDFSKFTGYHEESISGLLPFF